MPPCPRILIVEDDYLIRLTLAEALSSDGFDVVEAADGDEAAMLLRASMPFDLVLTDLQLPGALRGADVARLARADAPQTPVIFVSGRGLPEMQAASPIDLCIAKPYLPSEVCAAARRLTAAASLRQDLS
jgi:CheY-like chemotaxis protein